MFCEAHGFDATRRMMRRVKGGCVDMGTEFGLPEVSGITLHDALTPWMKEDLDDDTIEDPAEDVALSD